MTSAFGFKTVRDDGFTLIELLVVLATVAILTAILMPALAGTRPNPPAYQCLNNEKQLILGWQMYAEDNSDLLPPNDYPYTTCYYTYGNKSQLKNWVVGTMEQPIDASAIYGIPELTSPNTLLSAYVTNATVYHCPADNYLDPKTYLVHNTLAIHPRSYSMNSAVGTMWYEFYCCGQTLGAPVQGGWLSGNAYNANQQTWLTYGKMSSFARPGPANTLVFIDENPLTINDGCFNASAMAQPGQTYLIDYPSGNHGAAGVLAFADGHVIVHHWQDSRTYTPVQPGMGGNPPTLQSPDDPDCFYLAPLTSARR